MKLKQNLSLTGFRIFYLLNFLLKAPATKEEILKELSNNPNVCNATYETIRLDINTLKSAGFKIDIIGKYGRKKFKIAESLIKINLTKEEVQILQNVKFTLLELLNWENVLKLYQLFNKISNFIQDEEIKNELMDFNYFSFVNFEILKELSVLVKNKKAVTLIYNSPNSSQKEINIKLKEIKYSNSKLYLTGISCDYPDLTVLRIDNIIKIAKILNPESIKTEEGRILIYKISPSEINLLKEEVILSKTNKYIEIKMVFDNDFFAIQRLLSHGSKLIEINNPKLKEKYIQALEDILRLYGEEK